MRTPVMQKLFARIVRQELGIEAARSLGREAQGVLPFSVEPRRARADHARPSQGLPPPLREGPPVSGSRLAAAYRSRRAHPVGIVERALAHAETFGVRSPLLARDDERALADARASHARFERGEPLGPLDGLPFVVKEELDVAGYATRLGTSFLGTTPAVRDAVMVARLRAAGAIVIGQTPMTEYGLSPLGVNPHRRMPENAHRQGHLAGGSSTGSAVAVALGLTPFALGTDGGGSVRVPASHNGIFGLKPSYGRIPCTGHGVYGSTSVVHFGILGASTHDLAVALEASAGADAGDAPSCAAPPLPAGELVGALGRGVRGLRIGVLESEWARASDAVAQTGRAALAVLEREGAVLVPVACSLARHAAAIGYLTIAIEAGVALREVEEKRWDALGPDVRVFLGGLHAFSPDDYVDGQRLREALRSQVADVLAGVDLLALPTVATVAPPITPAEARSGILDAAALDASCRFVFLGNLLGLPACSVPVGVDARGLPIGLQLVGDAWDEACVLAAAAHLERVGAAEVPRAPEVLDLLG